MRPRGARPQPPSTGGFSHVPPPGTGGAGGESGHFARLFEAAAEDAGRLDAKCVCKAAWALGVLHAQPGLELD
jgi:hypothetical protein